MSTNSMASNSNLTVVEHSKISAPPGSIGHRSLALTFLDMVWLLSPPMHHVFFYDFPHSKPHFTQTVIPNLKHSLSLTLQHFFPYVSKLVVFPNNPITKPVIQHLEGDSIALTIAECDHLIKFKDLTGNHPRRCGNFYPLVPPLGESTSDNSVSLPLFSVQVTLFPDAGISIGMTLHHSLCDASSRFRFLKAWASISTFGGDGESFSINNLLIEKDCQPVFERLIDHPKLDESFLRRTRLDNFYQPPDLLCHSDKVRATFVLTRTNIDQLKKRVVTELPELEYVSSFTVSCGYIWSCIAKAKGKSQGGGGGGVEMGDDDDKKLQQFIIHADCRWRLDPPIPATYFGNCCAPCLVTIQNMVLAGENGFVMGAKSIGEAISKLVKNKDIFKYAETWHEGFRIPAPKTGVSGTPNLRFYDIDFGWGKVKKYETVSTDYYGSISINSSKESMQDIEIGLCFSSVEMEAFANIFNNGL